MVVRLLSATKKLNVQVLYYQLCAITYSSAACALTYGQLLRPASARDVVILVEEDFFGYGNQACLCQAVRSPHVH
jgi:late competence protein required for DNA uptake (superfamily II DNA/RNA helicase)